MKVLSHRVVKMYGSPCFSTIYTNGNTFQSPYRMGSTLKGSKSFSLVAGPY